MCVCVCTSNIPWRLTGRVTPTNPPDPLNIFNELCLVRRLELVDDSGESNELIR